MNSDLTRWNRAGLKRFRYVDGNAATYLEALRKMLSERLPEWDGLLGLQSDELSNYLELNDKRADIALEIIRSFARAAHVLTEHLDAYANEGYLGTATQWENVRRLIYGLDYHPNPPASASTQLVLYAKPEQKGLVASGLQIKHVPEGSSPVIFETLEDIQVDPAFNALRLKDWNRSQKKLTSKQLILDRIIEGLKRDDPIIIESAAGLKAYLLERATIDGICTVLELQQEVSDNCADMLIHLKPVERLEVFANTSTLIMQGNVGAFKDKFDQFKSEFGEYVFIGKGNTGIYRRISAISGNQLVLSESVTSEELLREPDCYVGIPQTIGETVKNEGEFSVTSSNRQLASSNILLVSSNMTDTISSYVQKAVYDEKGTINLKLDLSVPFERAHILTPPDVSQLQLKIDGLIDMNSNLLTLSAVKRMGRGDLCVAVCGSNIAAGRAQNITEDGAGRSSLETVDKWQVTKSNPEFLLGKTFIYGKFKEQARLQGWDINEDKTPSDRLTLENTEAARNLRAGKTIVIEQEGTGAKHLTKVKSINKQTQTDTLVLELEDPLPKDKEYTLGSTVIRANVVQAGHGETQPERILGSGNATLSNQEFLFPVSDVSFISDATQTSGVRADIRITVDGVFWTQISRFDRSEPTDLHYAVRITEDGSLRIVFGDGINGRRLPTGNNNVRIAWRKGSGEEGKLAAGSFKKPAHPHPRVEAVYQPFESIGGNNKESVTSLRRSAPASLLTMERAVSVIDFAELAASHASVWNARAELNSSGSEQHVCVIVVPAGGNVLNNSLKEEIEAFLRSHAIPGVHIKVEGYMSEPLKLDITLGVDKARFDPESISTEVQNKLLERFTLKNRAIAEPVYLSDIYQCVEETLGVEYSVCNFGGQNDAPQFLNPGNHGVLHLEDASNITLNVEEVQK